MVKKRIDLLLVEKNLAKSRTHAQALIGDGSVFVISGQDQVLVQKSNQLFTEEIQIFIQDTNLNKYVSRAGLKMEAAIGHIQKNIQGLCILDIGTSTGGFVDFFLQKSARQVVGIEVGHGQLAPQLVNHPSLILHEGINARYLSTEHSELFQTLASMNFDFISMDVSFISVLLIFPELVKLMNPKTEILSLIKPQFEVGPQHLNKNGIVVDIEQFLVVEEKIKQNLTLLGLSIIDYFPSQVIGKDGNQEFFVYAKK